jgi:hypothetical protein
MWLFYVSGVSVAFILSATTVIRLLCSLYFTYQAKNLAKVNFYWNFSSARFLRERDKPSPYRAVWYLLWGLVIQPLFSWLSALWLIISYFKIKSRPQTPEFIKEHKFKLGLAELSREQILEMLAEVTQFMGQCYTHPEEGKTKDGLYLLYLPSLNDAFSASSKISLDTEKKVFPVDSYSKLDFEHMENNYEYKFEGIKVLAKKLQEKEWKECDSNEIRYFILSKHQEIITVIDFLKLLLTESKKQTDPREKVVIERWF